MYCRTKNSKGWIALETLIILAITISVSFFIVKQLLLMNKINKQYENSFEVEVEVKDELEYSRQFLLSELSSFCYHNIELIKNDANLVLENLNENNIKYNNSFINYENKIIKMNLKDEKGLFLIEYYEIIEEKGKIIIKSSYR
ncbi:hypothetical protein [Clostridium grantii]|uniref:Uncharacterized protein n=1 Tax=Clostridium grantii DSM 8605 TaxID=1121316 RepID=A0A1M5SHW2_9CLOT|nr:hypothetical protein [Clostridium grantii]SHH37483.1 hypothetical protein SAMN02745207_00920 [Clostridium grantii DSM 8605]